jgi:hypothetical protein
LSLGSEISYSPEAHTVTVVHAVPSLVEENVMPGSHAAQRRSLSADPPALCPSPTVHVRQAVHALIPAELVNCPVAQAVQTLLLLAVALVLVHVPAAHGAATAWHALPSLTSENI